MMSLPVMKLRKKKISVTDIPEDAMKLLMTMNMKIPPKILKKEKM
jgi:hypothetical protein